MYEPQKVGAGDAARRVDPAGQTMSNILKARIVELDARDQPQGLAIAVHAASREIVSLFLPALSNDSTVPQAA